MSAGRIAVVLLLLLIPAGVARAQSGGSDNDRLRVDPTAVDFGDVDRGALVTHDVRVTNPERGDDDDVRITGIDRPETAECAVFQLQAPAALPIKMKPGQEATWRVTMQGNAVGHHECRIDLLDNDGDADFIRLSGNIVAPTVIVQPETVAFGEVAVGSTSEQRILITNDGTAPVTLSAITAGGSAEFVVSGLTAPDSIPARTTHVLTVTYRPAAAGADTGTVQIVHEGGARSIPLSGVGADGGPPDDPGADDGASMDPASYYTCSSGAPGGAVAVCVVVLFLSRRSTARRARCADGGLVRDRHVRST